ncbi:hypothetical protein L1N85_19295 [Paenibacillus alkaliterrae]|uniref:hypothetical protein n=1 Tax=Paenibacillus alkaliterrae TaxID=320909 RepID=UPI001F224E98|nr:hypothetical protein [Paenibacillus alkaliterrae]MCF2940541.1 hypothetical protein [Paenibacillus alkaliterrae]
MNLNEVLKWLGWLSIIGGVIAGVVIANDPDPMLEAIDTYYEGQFRWSVALTWIASGIASGVIFFSISRALELLEVIAENTQVKQQVTATSSDARTSYPTMGKTKSSSLEALSKGHQFKSND